MDITTLIATLDKKPELVEFKEVIELIDSLYSFTPTAFKNGNYNNEVGQNNGSCKLFSFAQLQGFSVQQTLNCFGAYYRNDVLLHLEDTDHQNIRNFILFGWDGIKFEGTALTPTV